MQHLDTTSFQDATTKSIGFRVVRGLGAVLVLLSLTLAGCGYAHRNEFPDAMRSVAVPIFQNSTFYQGVEFDLTEALTKEIEVRTPYKVTGETGADTILKGTITSINQSQLSQTNDAALPQEMEFKIYVDFEWKNLRTGEIIRDRKGFVAIGRYIPTHGVQEDVSIGQHQAVQAMATSIVSVMRKDW